MGNPKFETNNPNNTSGILGYLLRNIQVINKKLSSLGGVKTITGDFVDNTDPLNPVIDRGYKVYVARITQTGIEAPEVFILENTIGDIIWTRNNIGDYSATLEGAFTVGRTILFPNSNVNDSTVPSSLNIKESSTIDELILVHTRGESNTDDLRGQIEIRVYN